MSHFWDTHHIQPARFEYISKEHRRSAGSDADHLVTAYSLVMDRVSDAVCQSLWPSTLISASCVPRYDKIAGHRPTLILADRTLAGASARPGFTVCVVAVPGVGLCVGCSGLFLYIVLPLSGQWQHIHSFAATWRPHCDFFKYFADSLPVHALIKR